MNFLVKDIDSTILGYSPLGGNVLAGESVVMSLNAFGSGAGCSGSGIVPSAPYDLGRTVTHELGHFYNLKHTFDGYSCTQDDGIADTPNISNYNGGCPAPGSVNACEPSEKALTMNYMDYVNDACMYMLTEGQTTVVDTYINSIQNQFKQNTTPCESTASFNLLATNNSYSTCGNDAVFDINYSIIDGFNATVELNVSDIPPGVETQHKFLLCLRASPLQHLSHGFLSPAPPQFHQFWKKNASDNMKFGTLYLLVVLAIFLQ